METSKRIEIVNAEYSAKYAEIASRRMRAEQSYKLQLDELQDANAKSVCELQDANAKSVRELKDANAKSVRELQDANAKSVRELQDAHNEDLLLFAEEIKQLQAEKLARLQECAES